MKSSDYISLTERSWRSSWDKTRQYRLEVGNKGLNLTTRELRYIAKIINAQLTKDATKP